MNTKLLFEEPRNIGELEKGLKTYLHVEDQYGRRILSKKAETLTRSFYDLLFIQLSGTGVYMLRIDGASVSVGPNSQYFDVTAGSGVVDKGIVVGTGTTPVSMTDYKLVSQIGHGTGAGQLLYGSVSVTAPEIIGSMIRFYITRLVTNGSGSDITVNEVGLIAYAAFMLAPPTTTLIDRTLATFIVPNGSSRNIIYEIRVVV